MLFDQIDSAALIDIWPGIKNKPYDQYNIRLECDVPVYDPDVICFLRLMKFMPAPRIKFENSLKSFIKFSHVSQNAFQKTTKHIYYFIESIDNRKYIIVSMQDTNTDPLKLLEPKNLHPIIIAVITNVGISDKKYYIGLQDRIICVSGFMFCIIGTNEVIIQIHVHKYTCIAMDHDVSFFRFVVVICIGFTKGAERVRIYWCRRFIFQNSQSVQR